MFRLRHDPKKKKAGARFQELTLDWACYVCHTGKCPMGITTQDPDLRKRPDIGRPAEMLSNFPRATTEELKDFARWTGHDDVIGLSVSDPATTGCEIWSHTAVEHA